MSKLQEFEQTLDNIESESKRLKKLADYYQEVVETKEEMDKATKRLDNVSNSLIEKLGMVNQQLATLANQLPAMQEQLRFLRFAVMIALVVLFVNLTIGIVALII